MKRVFSKCACVRYARPSVTTESYPGCAMRHRCVSARLAATHAMAEGEPTITHRRLATAQYGTEWYAMRAVSSELQARSDVGRTP